MEEKRYIKLFNQGYFLSKNEPKVFSKLLKSVSENKEVYLALKAGEAEYKKEYFKQITSDKGIRSSKDQHLGY
ncbi:MAG: hypothetical protein AAF655_21465 [Bacteroidota bacterium]